MLGFSVLGYCAEDNCMSDKELIMESLSEVNIALQPILLDQMLAKSFITRRFDNVFDNFLTDYDRDRLDFALGFACEDDDRKRNVSELANTFRNSN